MSGPDPAEATDTAGPVESVDPASATAAHTEPAVEVGPAGSSRPAQPAANADRPRPARLGGLGADLGLDPEQIAQLEADRTLGLAVLSQLVFPEAPRYTVGEAGELTGLGADVLRFWRGFGFPDPEPDVPVFTDSDITVLRVEHDAVASRQTDLQTARALNRVIGNTMARLAAAMVEVLGDQAARVADRGDEVVTRVALNQARMVNDTLPASLLHVWRRHLLVAIRRRMTETTTPGGVNTAVGFCDLVGFTRLSQQISERELLEVVDLFEATVLDVVSAFGGRVVKNIGDEVLYAFAGAEDAVEVSLRLAEIHHYDETLPEVRVAVGFGPVLNREGDLYGPMVNKVSRVVPVCRPGRVLVTREAAGELAGNPRFVLDALRPRVLKDIGREQLWRVRLVSDPPPGPRLERTNPFGVIKDRLSGR